MLSQQALIWKRRFKNLSKLSTKKCEKPRPIAVLKKHFSCKHGRRRTACEDQRVWQELIFAFCTALVSLQKRQHLGFGRGRHTYTSSVSTTMNLGTMRFGCFVGRYTSRVIFSNILKFSRSSVKIWRPFAPPAHGAFALLPDGTVRACRETANLLFYTATNCSFCRRR